MPEDSWTTSSSGTTTSIATPASAYSPADVHYGLAQAKAVDRAATLSTARAATPERFTSTTPPKILQLPEAAWINPPLLPAEPAA